MLTVPAGDTEADTHMIAIASATNMAVTWKKAMTTQAIRVQRAKNDLEPTMAAGDRADGTW